MSVQWIEFVSLVAQVAPSTPVAPQVPVWVPISALVVSVLLAAIKVFELYTDSTRRSGLYFALTRDAFLRYNELGECIFLNCVLSGIDRAAIVTDVSVMMKRADGSRTLPLKILHYGQPADRGGVVHEHYFFSSSPVELVSVDAPLRRVFMCVVDNYDSSLKQAVETYKQELTLAAGEIRKSLEPGGGQEEQGPAFLKLQRLQQAFINAYGDSVQLERADYVVEMKYSYRDAGRSHGEKRSEVSTISFALPMELKAVLRPQLQRWATALAAEVILQKTEVVEFPVFPLDVVVRNPAF
jgi:hypothetical protein